MSELFDKARDRVALEDYVGKLVKVRAVTSDELRSECPLCRAGERSKGVFKISRENKRFFCFACERTGDVIDLHYELGRMNSLVEAAMDLAGGMQFEVKAKAKVEQHVGQGEDRAARILRMAADMWREGVDLIGTPAFGYATGRGIDPEIVMRFAGSAAVRFHPACPHSFDGRARVWVRAPGIVLKVTTPGGWMGGVHVTYLSPDGSRKSELDPPKRMWGPQIEETAAGRRRGGAWLIDPAIEAPLIVGEGWETTLGLATWLYREQGWREFRAAAALSLGSLQGGVQRDAEGCMDVWRPKGDPERPPFLWPPCNTPPDPAAGVLLAIDRDMSPQRVKARTGRGRAVPMMLEAEARARLCATLACEAWRGAGWPFATPMYPDPNGDWADKVKGAR